MTRPSEGRRPPREARLAHLGKKPACKGLRSWVSPWQVVLGFAAIYLGIALHGAGWDAMGFVRIGTRFDPGVSGGTMGYDGQFSYQIARSLAQSPTHLDVPAYRLQRILYPLAARILAQDHPSFLSWALILVNVASLVAGTALTESLMTGAGYSRWWALPFALNVGMMMAVRLDLNEPLAYALVQAGVMAWARRRPAVSAFAFGAAALAKEVTLLILVAYLAVRTIRQGLKGGGAWAAMALGPFLVWQAVLLIWLGDVGISSGGALSTPFEVVPLRGWWGIALQDPQGFLTLSILVVPVVIVPALVGLFAAFRSLSVRLSASGLALLFQAGATLFLPTSNLVDPLGATRFHIGLICTLLAFGAEVRSRRVLAYSQLWILTLAFLPGDRLLPSG